MHWLHRDDDAWEPVCVKSEGDCGHDVVGDICSVVQYHVRSSVHMVVDQQRKREMILDLLKAISFWDWYFLVMLINIGVFSFITWMEGELTIKEAVLFTALVFIPVINCIALFLIVLSSLVTAIESEDDPVIWRRKKERRPQ